MNEACFVYYKMCFIVKELGCVLNTSAQFNMGSYFIILLGKATKTNIIMENVLKSS
jgi:hypothetical protein